MDSLSMKPEEIEAESFRIIDAEAGEHGWADAEWQVVRRAIHTSADFEYASHMVFSDGAVEKAVAALKSGAGIVTDTNMALSGISKARLAPFGCTVTCHVADPDVAELATAEGITRSIAAMRKAAANPAQPHLRDRQRPDGTVRTAAPDCRRAGTTGPDHRPAGRFRRRRREQKCSGGRRSRHPLHHQHRPQGRLQRGRRGGECPGDPGRGAADDKRPCSTALRLRSGRATPPVPVPLQQPRVLR